MANAQTQIRSDLHTVGEVLTADFTYKVPVHQRDFSWTTDEVRQLWEDLMDAMHYRWTTAIGDVNDDARSRPLDLRRA